MSVVPPHGGRSAALIAALGAGSFAGGLFLPLSLVYFTVLTDIGLGLLGVLLSLATVVALPVPLLAGRAVERHGPRACVVTALGCQAVGYLGFVPARQPVAVFAASAVLAVGGRLYWSSVFALVAQHAETAAARGATTEGSVERWFAAMNTTRTVGVVGGGLIAGAVITSGRDIGYVALAWAAAGCCATAAVLVRAGTGRPAAASPTLTGGAGARGTSELLADHGFLALLALNAVFAWSTLSLGLALPTLVRSGLDGPGWLTSGLLVANAGSVAALGARGGRLAAERPGWVLLRWSALLWVLAYALLAWAALVDLPVAAVVLLLAVVALSAAEVLHAPASALLVTTVAGPARRARYLAVFQYSFVAAELVGPVAFTSLFALAPAAPFVLLVAVNMLALPGVAGAAALMGRRGTGPDQGEDCQ